MQAETGWTRRHLLYSVLGKTIPGTKNCQWRDEEVVRGLHTFEEKVDYYSLRRSSIREGVKKIGWKVRQQ